VRIDRLQKEYEIEVRWIAFPLHPETPEEGLTLEELFAGRNIDIDKARERLKQVARELGLPLGERKKTFNSRLAQELAKWAEIKGIGDRFHRAVFKAYFVEGINIAKVDELIRLSKSLGLPEEEAREVLNLRTYKEEVDSDWDRCYAQGITAVPTFMIDRQRAVGFQPYETLEGLLKTMEIKKRN
jgi:predicted DsbA family dithiol-disulfide isomerase